MSPDHPEARRVFFLPGAGGDGRFWRPLGERLPPGWQKRYFSWPGLGDQPNDSRVSGLADLSKLVADEWTTGDPVDLVAQSMGGVIALTLALAQPGRVRRLVLAATSGGLDVRSLGAEDWRPAYRREYPNAAPWIFEPPPDLTACLHEVGQPTLLIWGGEDSISPPAVGERLQQLLPQSVLQVVPSAGHDVAHWAAPLLAGTVERFLRAAP